MGASDVGLVGVVAIILSYPPWAGFKLYHGGLFHLTYH